MASWAGRLVGRSGWSCVMAFDGAAPVATGALFVSGDYAWLGFDATLPSHRRRGAQSALLARRLQEAAARGARLATLETGARLPGRPDNSYRNILRAGFAEAYLRQNLMSPPG
jgi:GNAT superfamily N-acetyltransferase